MGHIGISVAGNEVYWGVLCFDVTGMGALFTLTAFFFMWLSVCIEFKPPLPLL